MTDLEFYEIRYSGKAASVVRGFRAVYLGLFFNCMIMATVNLAACKIAGILFGLPRWQTLLFVGLLNVVFAAHSGLWGVLVIDMIQFFIKMTAVIAAAYFALQAPAGRRAARAMVAKLSAMKGPGGVNYLNMLPDFTNNWDLAVAVFIMPIAVQWWAVWYPGAEPGGGSYIAQRMLASKSEKDALGAVLFFNVAHYVLRPWPWILTALCSHPRLPGALGHPDGLPQPRPEPARPRHRLPGDAEVPAGRLRRPDGGRPHRRQLLDHPDPPQLGRVLPGPRLLPALHQEGRHREALRAGGPARHRLPVRAVLRARSTCSTRAKDAFDIILQIGAGTGLLYLVRWFWWRVNAWCEVVAMVSSFLVSLALLVLAKNGVHFSTHVALLVTIAVTTVCWVATAYLGPQTDRRVLVEFYKKVRPFGPGWTADPRGGGPRRGRGAHGRRQHPAGAARLVHRLHDDLVGALRGRQLPLRPHGLRARRALAVFAVAGVVLDARGRPALAGRRGEPRAA